MSMPVESVSLMTECFDEDQSAEMALDSRNKMHRHVRYHLGPLEQETRVA